MKKEEFVRSLAQKEGISHKEARNQVNRVFGHVVEVVPTLADGESLDIVGVVSFKVKDVSARNVRNPRTGETVAKGKTRKVNASVKATLKNAVKA